MRGILPGAITVVLSMGRTSPSPRTLQQSPSFIDYTAAENNHLREHYLFGHPELTSFQEKNMKSEISLVYGINWPKSNAQSSDIEDSIFVYENGCYNTDGIVTQIVSLANNQMSNFSNGQKELSATLEIDSSTILLDDYVTPSIHLLNSLGFRFSDSSNYVGILEFCLRAFLFKGNPKSKIIVYRDTTLRLFMDFTHGLKITPKLVPDEEVPNMAERKIPKFILDGYQCDSSLERLTTSETTKSDTLYICLKVPQYYMGLGIKSVVDAEIIQPFSGMSVYVTRNEESVSFTTSHVVPETNNQTWALTVSMENLRTTFFSSSSAMEVLTITGTASLQNQKEPKSNSETSGNRKLYINEMASFNLTLSVMRSGASKLCIVLSIVSVVFSSVSMLLLDFFLPGL